MEPIWTKYYDSGVPATINPDEYQSIPEMLAPCFKSYAQSTCFTNFGEKLTFQQVDELSTTFAGYLQTKCGLQKGDHVAILMPSVLQYPVALIGALKAGMVIVNISPLYNRKQVHEALVRTGVKCLLVLANFARIAQEALPGTQIEHVIVTEIGDLFRPLKRMLFNFVARYVKFMVPSWSIPRAVSFRETIQSQYQTMFTKPEIHSNDLAYLQFTEGRSAGAPKYVMLTHRNVIANGLQTSAWVDSFLKKKGNKVIFGTVPFFKIAGTTVYLLTTMRAGFINHLITNPRNVAEMIKEMQDNPYTMIICVRPLLNELLRHQEFYHIDFSSLRVTFSAGMAVPQALADRWKATTRSVVLQTYVMAEASPLVCATPLSAKEFSDYLGLPISSTEIKICDEAGEEVGINQIGEICVRGPQIMKGYWGQPEETKAVLSEDGWLKTSDCGAMNEKGYVKIIDRKEDIIRTDQGTVYPSEVEEVIMEVGGVSETAVVQGRSSSGSVIIKAYVVRADRSLTTTAILTHCSGCLRHFKIPNEIEFCEEIPKSPVGFLMRSELRKKSGS